MQKFSILERPFILKKLQSEEFDVLIIGGGITGAGIALDAASRGLKTALIEKNDFAFGTSSRSTKLIHGGLRYLKQLEFGLVKEVGSERAIVHNLAPHLVVPEKMLLPLYEKKGLGYWLTSIGLMIYDYLAGVKPSDQRRMLTRKKTLKYEPLLNPAGVKGGAIYAEYRTDDARLTIEIMKSAFAHGAVVLNYVEAEKFVYDDNRVTGVQGKDVLSGESFEIRSRTIINACGPWVDELREIDGSKKGKRLHLTKGVHIVVAHHKFPVQQSIYFDVEDGRMIFAIPRGEKTYIGTTDTSYKGRIDDVKATTEDAEYLLSGVNATFQNVNLRLDDIESSWAGLRPLIHEDGKSASQLSRKDEIFESPTGLISIAGGKLTGYRKMSERVVALLIKKYFRDRTLQAGHTERIKLGTSDFKSRKQVRKFIEAIRMIVEDNGLPAGTATYLVENYGRQTETILHLFENFFDPSPDLRLLKAELLFGVNHEMVVSLADFFVRRTGLLYFDIARVRRYKNEISSYMSSLLPWTTEKQANELRLLEKLIVDASLSK